MTTTLQRITFDPAVMGGKPCIRDMRVTVGMIVGLIAAGHARADVLRLYPYLEGHRYRGSVVVRRVAR